MAAISGLKLNFGADGTAEAVSVTAPGFEHRCHIEDCEYFELSKEEIKLSDQSLVTIYNLLCTAITPSRSIFDIERDGKCPKDFWRMPGLKIHKKREK